MVNIAGMHAARVQKKVQSSRLHAYIEQSSRLHADIKLSL